MIDRWWNMGWVWNWLEGSLGEIARKMEQNSDWMNTRKKSDKLIKSSIMNENDEYRY